LLIWCARPRSWLVYVKWWNCQLCWNRWASPCSLALCLLCVHTIVHVLGAYSMQGTSLHEQQSLLFVQINMPNSNCGSLLRQTWQLAQRLLLPPLHAASFWQTPCLLGCCHLQLNTQKAEPALSSCCLCMSLSQGRSLLSLNMLLWH